MIRKIVGILTLVICVIYAKKFCYKQTDGFALYKILSTLPLNPSWETPPLTEEKTQEIRSLLNQPFHYLAKGAQSYVFVSEDNQVVVKFFRLYHLRPPAWMSALKLPLPLQPFVLHKMLSKREELEKDFDSYALAYNEMQEETGLIYLHLNKTDHLKQKIILHDKLNIAHELELDQMEFLVQKKADLVYPRIDAIVQTEGMKSARAAISGLVHLLQLRCEKGIFDKDPDLNTNFGFIDKTAVQIDIGRFRPEEKRESAEVYRDEILRITDNLRQWLDQRYPELSSHLLSEIEK